MLFLQYRKRAELAPSALTVVAATSQARLLSRELECLAAYEITVGLALSRNAIAGAFDENLDGPPTPVVIRRLHETVCSGRPQHQQVPRFDGLERQIAGEEVSGLANGSDHIDRGSFAQVVDVE